MLNAVTVPNALLNKVKKSSIIPVYACALLLWAVSALIIPNFISYQNTMDLVHRASFLGIVAAAQTVVIIMAGIDLSVSGVMTLSSMLVCALVEKGLNPLLAILITLALCSLVGVFNGYGYCVLGVSPMIMTMATNSLIEGGLLLWTNGTPPNGQSALLTLLGRERSVAGVPNAFWVWILISVGVYWLLNKSKFGRIFYGMGTSERVSFLSGIPVKKMTLLAYVCSSVLAGIAGILYFGYLGNTYIELGKPYQMHSIAVTVLGGTSIAGGSGSYVGTMAGVLILVMLTNMLSVLKTTQAVRDILLGGIIVTLLLLYRREKKF